METAELFLIYGRTKEVLIGTLSRKSELKRLRIKRSQIKKWAEKIAQKVGMQALPAEAQQSIPALAPMLGKRG